MQTKQRYYWMLYRLKHFLGIRSRPKPVAVVRLPVMIFANGNYAAPIHVCNDDQLIVTINRTEDGRPEYDSLEILPQDGNEPVNIYDLCDMCQVRLTGRVYSEHWHKGAKQITTE